MSSLNEIGRCYTDYGYVVIGSYGDPRYNKKIAYFYRNDGEGYKFDLYDIGKIMENALDPWTYDYLEEFGPKDLEDFDTFKALSVLQAELFQQRYEIAEVEDDDD